MQHLWFAIAQFIERTFDWFLTPWGWVPVTVFIIIMFFGTFYWLLLQGRYNRRALEKGEHL